MLAYDELEDELLQQTTTWDLGTPSDVAFLESGFGRQTDLIAVTAPDIPQALVFRNGTWPVAPEPFAKPLTGPEYMEVGLGTGQVGSQLAQENTQEAEEAGLFLAYPEKGRVRR